MTSAEQTDIVLLLSELGTPKDNAKTEQLEGHQPLHGFSVQTHHPEI